MAQLCGKGIWLAHSYDFQRAVEIATHINGSHLIVKVGHGPYFFPETARALIGQVRALGFRPIAWVQLTSRAPRDAEKAIIASLKLGYEATVLFVGPEQMAGDQVRSLAESLLDAAVPTERLFLASLPLSHIVEHSVIEMLVPVCQGGWMPLCFPDWDDQASTLIDKGIYQALGDLSLLWGRTPEVYPVLAPYYWREESPFLPEKFSSWLEAIARHGTDFFSVFHASMTEKSVWSMLRAVDVPCMGAEGRTESVDGEPIITADGTPLPQPVYITVAAGDTVTGIISRYGMDRQQFWVWNAHLWESLGLPRDPDYLQAGWRIRVK